MALFLKTSSLLFTVTFMVAYATATRDLPTKPGFNIEASGGLVECWNALTDLRSCTNEIVQFFLNGQTDIGPDCCGAITIVTHHCWPSMLTSLGFTAEEGNTLRGYCDASSGPAEAPSPLASSQLQPLKDYK